MCSVSMTLMRSGCVARVVPRSLPSTDDVEDNKSLVSLLHCNPTSWTDLDKLARLTLELKENAETYEQHRVPMMQSERIVFMLQVVDDSVGHDQIFALAHEVSPIVSPHPNS